MRAALVQEVRKFNRYYTGIIGLFDHHILNSSYSLPEARVLYELSHQQPCTASQVMTAMKIDKGYLSRILKSFSKRGLLIRKGNKEDGRSSALSLSAKGNLEFQKLNKNAIDQITKMLAPLSEVESKEVVHHMKRLIALLNIS